MSLSPIIREASFVSEGNDHKWLKSLSHRLSTKGASLLHIHRLFRNSMRRAWKPKPSVQGKGQSLAPRNDTDLMTSPDTDYQTSQTSSIRINTSGCDQEQDKNYVDCFLPKRKIHHIRGGYRVFIHSFGRSSAEVQSLKRANSERCTNNPVKDHDLYPKSSFFDRWRTRRRSSGSFPCKHTPKPTAPLISSEKMPFKQTLQNYSNMKSAEHFFSKSKQVFDTCLKSDERHDVAGKTYNHGG